MKPPRTITLALASAGLCILLEAATAPTDHAAAPENNPSARPDYSSFRIITERNIFNASRSARSPARSSRIEAPRRAARVDSFTFVGTINYDKGAFAFFDSTSADFRKTLQAGSTIAGLQVIDVSDHSVKLSNGTNTFDLRMGMQMRREEEGQWRPSGASETPTSSPSSSSSESAPENSSDEEDAILKRLMQQREQELR
jgi:hypothetical protein